MTDRELDAAMQRVLLDSIERRMRAIDWESLPPLSPSPRHQAQMRAMLKDPLKWAARRERPLWKQVLLRAAMFLLALLMGLSVVTLSIPSARAAMVRWFIERRDATHWVYHYTGQGIPDRMPVYEITALPEGFVEVERFEAASSISVTYENSLGQVLYFEYHFMSETGLAVLEAENSDIYDVTVHQMPGKYVDSRMAGNLNEITWIDENANIHFYLSAPFNQDSIVHMAESVSLAKTPK